MWCPSFGTLKNAEVHVHVSILEDLECENGPYSIARCFRVVVLFFLDKMNCAMIQYHAWLVTSPS